MVSTYLRLLFLKIFLVWIFFTLFSRTQSSARNWSPAMTWDARGSHPQTPTCPHLTRYNAHNLKGQQAEHLEQGWKFALWFFIQTARFVTKRANRSLFRSFLNNVNHSFPSICKEERERIDLFVKSDLLLSPFFKRAIKSKAKKCDLNLLAQFSVFSSKRSKAHS